MAKGDDEERRRARRQLRAVIVRPKHARMVELLGEIYDLIDEPGRGDNNRGPAGFLARVRRRDRFIAAGVDVARALALAVRGR